MVAQAIGLREYAEYQRGVTQRQTDLEQRISDLRAHVDSEFREVRDEAVRLQAQAEARHLSWKTVFVPGIIQAAIAALAIVVAIWLKVGH